MDKKAIINPEYRSLLYAGQTYMSYNHIFVLSAAALLIKIFCNHTPKLCFEVLLKILLFSSVIVKEESQSCQRPSHKAKNKEVLQPVQFVIIIVIIV